MRPSKHNELDPLFVIFEHHLYNFHNPEIDRKTFIGHVIQDYLTYLRKMNISIPKSLEEPIIDELFSQINTMLVKKIYGCLTIQDYQKRIPAEARKKVKSRYSRLSRKLRAA